MCPCALMDMTSSSEEMLHEVAAQHGITMLALWESKSKFVFTALSKHAICTQLAGVPPSDCRTMLALCMIASGGFKQVLPRGIECR